MDYHTAKTQDEKTSYVTYRHYLQDAVFLAGIESEDTAFCSNCSRRCCTRPFRCIWAAGPARPPCRFVWEYARAACRRCCKRNRPLCPGRQSRILLDADPLEPGTAPQRDMPVSFDPHHRQYGYRSVREFWQKVPDSPETTEHDPFREL